MKKNCLQGPSWLKNAARACIISLTFQSLITLMHGSYFIDQGTMWITHKSRGHHHSDAALMHSTNHECITINQHTLCKARFGVDQPVRQWMIANSNITISFSSVFHLFTLSRKINAVRIRWPVALFPVAAIRRANAEQIIQPGLSCLRKFTILFSRCGHKKSNYETTNSDNRQRQYPAETAVKTYCPADLSKSSLNWAYWA